MTTVSNVYKAQLLVLVDLLIEYSADRDVEDEKGNYLGRRDGWLCPECNWFTECDRCNEKIYCDEDSHLTMCTMIMKLEHFLMVHTEFTKCLTERRKRTMEANNQ